MKQKTFLMLGRYGDIVNFLPALWYISRTETRPRLIVAADHASILDGVSYVEPVIFPGRVYDLDAANDFALDIDRDYYHVHASGIEFQERKTKNFLTEPWAVAGLLDFYGRLPLHFDLRDRDREYELVKQLNDRGRPIVLVATHGISSPFNHAFHVIKKIRTSFPEANVIDLSTVKAERFYDLIGLYEAAQCLVTIDTGHLHLARASSVPVIALTNGEQEWLTSPKTDQHIFYCTYHQYYSNSIGKLNEIIEVIGKCMNENYFMPIAKDLGIENKEGLFYNKKGLVYVPDPKKPKEIQDLERLRFYGLATKEQRNYLLKWNRANASNVKSVKAGYEKTSRSLLLTHQKKRVKPIIEVIGRLRQAVITAEASGLEAHIIMAREVANEAKAILDKAITNFKWAAHQKVLREKRLAKKSAMIEAQKKSNEA